MIVAIASRTKKKMKLYNDTIPNKFSCKEKEIIKTGFVFNTGYKDVFLEPNDNVVKLGNHEIYEMYFSEPLKYIGFIYFGEEKQIILLFQDWKDREKSRNEGQDYYTSFFYNSKKSIYCIQERTEEVINIYMNDIQFFVESFPEKKTVYNSKPLQLSLF